MSANSNNEESMVYCKYCGKLCLKLVLTTKENPGRLSFACPTPRFIGGYGWMEKVDKVQSSGRFEALELVLKEKNEQIEQLELENEQLWKELVVEKLHTRFLRKLLKGIIGGIVLFVLLHWLYNGSNETKVFELPDV
ncbi:hypothetical protein LIER_32215 [Lithospermum erythrorhizon]|uniref:Uncharacterized protein n=1 Tax=Lithospermum erythrorhizon TaxID=34254 RepID=A0AAV3RUI6_LITER